MENKQTAVEWLADKMVVSGFIIPQTFVEQAKQMEKEQIMKAIERYYPYYGVKAAEQYYNETYKQ